ncbi:hypothetical protein ACFYSJ_36255 [Streptomyces sp. NPDC005248]
MTTAQHDPGIWPSSYQQRAGRVRAAAPPGGSFGSGIAMAPATGSLP